VTARTPEQDGAPVSAEAEPLTGPGASQRIRRRLAFSPAVSGEASPWQRSAEAWRDAGLSWIDERPEDVAPRRARRRPGWTVVIAVGVVVIAGGGVAAVSGEGAPPAPGVAAAVPAEGLFVGDPAAPDGLVQELTGVAAHGATVVASGAEAAGDGGTDRDRAQFLVSGDGGRTWRLGDVRTRDGAAPPPGARPRMVAGGDGAWVALGSLPAPGGVVAWTSANGRAWTRLPSPHVNFYANDRVNSLTRTAAGFAAAGAHSPDGTTTKGVVWTSPDGGTWQRRNVPGAGAFDKVAASGGILLAHGTSVRTETRTVRSRGGKPRKVTRTVQGDGLWRSADGGVTWAPVSVRHGLGSYGPVSGLTAGPGGFFLKREGKRVTGRGQKRRTSVYCVIFSSRNGASWTPLARLSTAGYVGTERLAGTSAGLAALVRGKGNKGTVFFGSDGRSWRPGAARPDADLSGLAVVQGGAVATGRRDADGFLALAGRSPGTMAAIDLSKVPGAVRPERTLNAIASGAGGRLMVVGSSNGDAASWSTVGGSGWSRGKVTAPGPRGRRRLVDVIAGPHGWLAVGYATPPEGTASPLVVASSDGTSWTGATLPGAGGTSGVTAGPQGYVVVGTAGDSPGAWHSSDLKHWTRGAGDLSGPGRMRDVVAASAGYVAVGASRERPAIWTSGDGRRWSAVAAPSLPPGADSFTQVVARGSTVVARGTGFVAWSLDGGRTWATGVPQGADRTTSFTAVTATSKGFLLAAARGVPGRRDVLLWSWTGTANAPWRRVAAAGTGLTGPGDQRLTALTSVGGEVVGTGISADSRGEIPTLWRNPSP
jgi:hypothetical protein